MYYLERFETSKDNLRAVLRRRIDKFAFINKEYNPEQAYIWADDIVEDCAEKNFVNDERFAEFKISAYLRAGKPKKYIELETLSLNCNLQTKYPKKEEKPKEPYLALYFMN